MADNLANIFGTEKDRVNCPFYYKIGACRHGDRCTRQHNRPKFSETLLIPSMYVDPKLLVDADGKPKLSPREVQEHFEDFYEDVYEELVKCGRIVDLVVCENLSEHLLGAVYVQYDDEDNAEKAYKMLNGRYYNGRQLYAEYSPVTDFREARCRQHDKNNCDRGAWCNFLHIRHVPSEMRYRLFGEERHGGGSSRHGRHYDDDRRRGHYDDSRDRRHRGYDDRRAEYAERRDYRHSRGDSRSDYDRRSHSREHDRYR